MRSHRAPKNDITHRVRLITRAAALAMAAAVSMPPSAHADQLTPPPVPVNIEVPAGNRVFLEGHAVGTQDYICLPAGSGVAWTFLRPQATLFNDAGFQVITHFLSPNPVEGGTPRATWQHSRDTSAIWARAIAPSSDPAFVAPGAIPWLLLQVVGEQDGPRGSRTLAGTTFIQRLNTSGGIAPSSGCALSTDVGKTAFVPYTADYYFYRDEHRPDDNE